MRRPLALVAFVSLVAVSAAQESLDAKLRGLCEEHLKKERIVGMSVAVLDRKEVVLSAGFGFADREAQRPVDEKTLIRLASISKPITSVGLMRLVERKGFDIDADIRNYVPEYPEKPWKVTAKHLLNHTSGFRHYMDNKADDGFEAFTTEQSLARMASDPLQFEPGTKFAYSTHAFTLVARTIEKVDGRSFVDYMRAEVFPVAKGELDCEVSTDVKPNRSALYVRSTADVKLQPKRHDLSWKYGGGGMEATAMGLARFAEAVRLGELVQPATRDLMWKATTLADGKPHVYGLGWRVASNGQVSHGGSQQGSATHVIVDPKAEITVVVLANTQLADAQGLAQQLLGAVLEGRKSHAKAKGRGALDVPTLHPLSSR